MPVASLTYFNIGIMVRSGYHAADAFGNRLNNTEVNKNLLVVELSIILVHLREFVLKLTLITLRQTSHYEQLLQFAFLLPFGKLQYRVYALFLGISDKTAGIYNCNLAFRILAIVVARVSVILKLLHQNLAVHKILRAAKGDYVNVIALQNNTPIISYC